MHVDERGEHQLTNFNGKQNRGKVTETDHAMVQLHVNLKFDIKKPQRTEAYNYKSDDCRKYFKYITTDTTEFTHCFESNEGFQTQINKWEHTIKNHIVEAFPKIRSRKRKFAETDIGVLLEKRKQLKLESVQNPEAIDNIENKISNKTSENYFNKIKETMGHLGGDDGAISHHGVWKAQKNLFPKDKQCNPMALKDSSGQIITNPAGIKKLCLEEILDRVRHRKIHPELIELQHLKERLCEKRLDLVKHIKSEPWSMAQLDKVLKSLKKKV